MSELISGKEAKKAWADGEEIEIAHQQGECWISILNTDKLSVFDLKDVVFRLKPRTITINGIKVPAPFKAEHGDMPFVISSSSKNGYTQIIGYIDEFHIKNNV